VGSIQTGLLTGFRKSSGGTGIVIPVKKSATGAENAGILRIPAGITNLGLDFSRSIKKAMAIVPKLDPVHR
jgi:hypothetical protein